MSKIFRQIDHECTKVPETFPPRKNVGQLCYHLKKWWYSLILVSPKHPSTIKFLASESQIRSEQRRHYKSPSYYIVHPLSKLSVFHGALLVVIYMAALYFKTVELAFIRRSGMGTGKYYPIIEIIEALDILSWVNLLFMCFNGVIKKKDKSIEIEFEKILLYRIKSFVFWAELISSVPRSMICYSKDACSRSVWNSLGVLRLTVLGIAHRPAILIKQTLNYFHIESRHVIIVVNLTYVLVLATHLMACSFFAASRYYYWSTGYTDNASWILVDDLLHASVRKQYRYSFFIASAQTFGITVMEIQGYSSRAESTASALNYIIGKFLNLTIWMTILNVILYKDLQITRFQEMMSQLSSWMDKRELPRNLRKRVVEFYNFYYKRKFFNRKQLQGHFPHTLKAKIRQDVYRVLKQSEISLFGKLSDNVIELIGHHFVAEIYSPNDVIMHSGMPGHHLYLVASGSVAVYSHSGKEVCHLYDGAYFGELALMLRKQKSTATIVAIETTKVYKLAKEYFNRYIISNKELHDMLLQRAYERLKLIKEAEEECRKALFAEQFK